MTRATNAALVRLRYEHERLERIARALARMRSEAAAGDPDGDDGSEGR